MYVKMWNVKSGTEYEARNCVDGDDDTGCESSCRHVVSGVENLNEECRQKIGFPWIYLDLGSEVDVNEVKILNAGKVTDSNFRVFVSNKIPPAPTRSTTWFTGGTLLGSRNEPVKADERFSIKKTAEGKI